MYSSSKNSIRFKDLPVCFNCQELGHYAKECRNPTKCARCGGDHRTDNHGFAGGNHRTENHREKTGKFSVPSGYKLVKDSSYRSSSSSSSSSSKNNYKRNDVDKKVVKKPFNIKPKEKTDKMKKVKKVFYVEESGSEKNSDNYSQSEDEYHDDELMDEDD